MNQQNTPPATRLDVIGSVDFGYRMVWAERYYLLQLAIVPVVLKILCLGAVVSLGWEQNYIRSSLVLLPATLAEGWMLAHLVRLILLNQRWPLQPSGNIDRDMAELQSRARGILGGMVLYTLIKQIQAGFLALMVAVQAASPAPLPAEAIETEVSAPSVLILFAAFFLLVATLWAVRLMFLYIPVAATGSAAALLRVKGGFILSLRILAIWLVGALPCILLMIFLMSLVLPVSVEEGAQISLNFLQKGALLLLQAAGDALVALISTAAVTFALRPMIFLDSPRPVV